MIEGVAIHDGDVAKGRFGSIRAGLYQDAEVVVKAPSGVDGVKAIAIESEINLACEKVVNKPALLGTILVNSKYNLVFERWSGDLRSIKMLTPFPRMFGKYSRAMLCVVRDAAVAVSQMHASGLVHGDLHAGNVLWRVHGEESWRWVPHSASAAEPLLG